MDECAAAAENSKICSDLAGSRAVSTEDGISFAQKYGLMFMETSAKTAENVDKAFIETAEVIYRKLQQGLLDIGSENSGVKMGSGSLVSAKVRLDPVAPPKKGRCC